MSLSYRKHFVDLLCKPMDWFLYDRDLRHERVNCFVKLTVKFDSQFRSKEYVNWKAFVHLGIVHSVSWLSFS